MPRARMYVAIENAPVGMTGVVPFADSCKFDFLTPKERCLVASVVTKRHFWQAFQFGTIQNETRKARPGPRRATNKLLSEFFAHRLCLGKQVQIVGTAGLGIRARHVEAAEGMRSHHGAGALAVDVEIADVEVLDGAVHLVA